MEEIEKLKKICTSYDIEFENLSDIINDPKLMPMLRGKSFEYTALRALEKILPKNFIIEQPKSNSQLGMHDIDIQVTTPDKKQHSCECKLGAKGKFKFDAKNEQYVLEIKCMQSRTKGEEIVKKMAPKIGVSVQQLEVHNDQYRKQDFDYVITTIGNNFYTTNKEDGMYIFNPNEIQKKFLSRFNCKTQQEAFNLIFFAKSKDLTINKENNIVCRRKKCTDKYNCNFIPNYPRMIFQNNNIKPDFPWFPINEIFKECY